MQPTNQKQNVEQTYRTMLIVWFALLNSQFLLLAVLYFAKPKVFGFDFSQSLLGENSAMVVGLAVLAISTFLLSLVLRKRFTNRAINEQKTELVQTGMIIGCALSESITLLGLVLAFALSYRISFCGSRSESWELFCTFHAAKI
jgi:F0F1-type ATP synthase membrane subunit c/vacuolar-type H+-ATPase subunit K